jgi:NADP-dependent 3-hydroxy acid dehydrogenase YdfG
MGSHAADHYFEGGGGYCATKAALRAFAEVVALETRDFGVRTIVLSPGAIRNRDSDDSVNKIAPDDVADLVWRLVQAGDSLIVGEVEIRPRRPAPSALTGMDRLQIL